jgi:hypothetical protein
MSQTQQHYQAQDRAVIPSRPIDLGPITESITSTLIHCRDGLAKAANGQTIAPSSQKAAQYRKQIAGGVSDPVMQLAQTTVTDLDDGVAYHVATAWLTRLQTFFSVYAKALYRRAPRSIPVAFNTETRKQYLGDLAAHRVALTSTCDEAALVEAISTARAHAAALEDFAVACEAELASRHSTRIYALKALAQ